MDDIDDRDFEGPVLRRGEDGYDEELATHNSSVTHRPEVVVGAAVDQDVVRAVTLATRRGLGVGVQASGHGMTVPADGVLVTTRRLDHVRVDPARRVATIGAGARWRDVLPVLAEHGLAPLSGSSPEVAVAGYVLGGGIGMLGRRHGYAADHVRRVRLATADGRLRDVTAESDPGLFTAVRGSKGQLGIATELELDLFEVSELVGGGVYLDGAATEDVLAAYAAWTPGLPRETATSLLLATFPDMDGVAPELRGRHVVHLRFAHVGEPSEVAGLLGPMRAAGPVLLDTVRPLTFTEIGTIHHEPVGPYQVHESGFYTGALRDTDLAALVGAAGPDAEEPMLVEVRHHGGAYAEAPLTPNVVGGREAELTVYVGSMPDPDSTGHDRDAHARLRAAFAGNDQGSVLNFLGAGTDADQVRSSFAPGGLEAVLEAKRVHDPDDVFRVNAPLG